MVNELYEKEKELLTKLKGFGTFDDAQLSIVQISMTQLIQEAVDLHCNYITKLGEKNDID